MNRAELNAMKARAARNARLNAIADRRALLRYVAELLRVVEDYAGACARCQGRGEYPYDRDCKGFGYTRTQPPNAEAQRLPADR